MQTQEAVICRLKKQYFQPSKDTDRENKSRLEGAWKECQRDRDKLLQALEQEGGSRHAKGELS